MRFQFLEHDQLTGAYTAQLLEDDGETHERVAGYDIDELHLRVLSLADPSERLKVNSIFMIVDQRVRVKINKPR